MKKRSILAALLSMCLLFTGCKESGESQTADTGSSDIVSSVISSAENGDVSSMSESMGSGSSSSSDDGSSSANSFGSSDTNSSDQPSVSAPESSDTSSSDNDASSTDTSDPTSSSSSKPTSSSSSKPTSSSTSRPTSSSTSRPTSSSTSRPTSSSTSRPTSSSNVTKPDPITNGGFKVSGTKLLDANGNEFIMRGINHAHVWYQWNLNEALDGIAKTSANCVRLVLADGDAWGKTSADDLKNVIEQCEKRKLIAIVEIHDATYGTAGDDDSRLVNAARYWIEMKDILNEHKDTVIVNIANEWHNGSWAKSDEWAAGYKKVIPMIRNAGVQNTLMVDCDGNGQYPDSLWQNNNAKNILAADSLGNTMFSVHMYEYAGSDSQTIKNTINKCLNMEICTVIGEFGFKHTNGDVDEQTIMDYCTEKGMGYIGWSWLGNGGGVEYLDLAYDWSGNSLSSWGNTLINGTNGIKQTSKKCTVFN